MLGRMMVKEWKGKFGLFIFALAGFLFFGIAFSAYSQDKEALDLLMGTLTLVFVPVFALLLGASGFSSEFRDDAWAYLFSRPVKKWRIWLAKYVSLLSMLAVVLLVFRLIVEFHPAVKPARQMFSIPLRFGEDISFLVLAYFLPLVLFTTAFSMSILSEKSHIVVFLAALITYLLGIGLTYGPALMALLQSRLWTLPGLSWLAVVGPLVPLSFAVASILTLGKADFSQARRRAWVFTKYAAVFLAVSFGIGFVWNYASLSLQRTRSIWAIESRSGQAYFTTDSGIYRFDTTTGRKDRLVRSPHIWSVSLGGDGQVVYTSFSGGLRAPHQDIWIIDGHGTKPRPLIRMAEAGSPFNEGYIYPPVRISPGGDKVAFIVWGLSGATAKNLWCIKTDGTGLKGCSVDVPKGGYPVIRGFLDSSRTVLISVSSGGKTAWQEGAKLLKVDVESGAVETLAEHTHSPRLQPGDGPRGEPRLIAYIDVDRERSLSTLRLLDPVTLEKRDAYQADSIEDFRWSPAGDKLAFIAGKTKLGVYSVAQSQVLQVKEVAGYDFRWPSTSLDWTQGDGLVLRKLDSAGGSLSILDGSLTEKRTLPLPFTTHSAFQISGAGQYVLVTNTEKYELWGVDLKTDKWQRIY